MTILHGRNVQIYCNGVDLTGTMNAINVNSVQELADVTVFGHVGNTFYPGLAKDTGTIEALYVSTEATVFQNLRQTEPGYGMMIPLGSALGSVVYATNEATLKSNNMKSVVTDVNRATINFDVDNYPFEVGAMLTAGIQTVAAASSAQGTSCDNGSASGTTGGGAYLQIFTLPAGTLTISVQDSATGAWAGEQTTTCTFTVASTSGIPATERKAITSQVKQYARSAWVSSVSTATFALALIRY